MEHHKLSYLKVASAELSLEPFCIKAGHRSISIPLYKVTSPGSLDDSSVKLHNPAPLGVRFGTLYLTVTTKLQENIYRWFWLSLVNHLNFAPQFRPQSRPQSPTSSLPSSPRGREGLIGSGEIGSSPVDESLLPPLTPAGKFPDTVVTSENLKEMILLLGIETSDEEFEEMCDLMGLERPWNGKSPVRSRNESDLADYDSEDSEGDANDGENGKSSLRRASQSSGRLSDQVHKPAPRRLGTRYHIPKELRPHMPIDEFLSQFANVLPRRPTTPHSSDHPMTLAMRDGSVDHAAMERHETSSIVTSLFLGNQLDHDEYIWETALVNDDTRITHLVVGQEIRPSAQLLQTADAAYDLSMSPSSSSPSSLNTNSSGMASSSSILGSSPPRFGNAAFSSSPGSPPPIGITLTPVTQLGSSPPYGSHIVGTSPTAIASSSSSASLLRSSLSSAYGFLSRFSSSSVKERRKDLIYVQDRETGKVVEEKMPQYLRRMLRGMYSNPTGRQIVHQGMSKSLLKRLTFNQAKKYTAPTSTSEIPDFIAFHNIDANEFLDPVSSFANFNDFFIRKLKPETRPITSPEDPAWAICPADCRLHVYETLNEAQRLWIKGKTFSLRSLLSNAALEEEFSGCSLVIARLAPQDYHRFHYPVSGFSGKYFSQGDAYFTVNPIAVRENVDVYSLNKRTSVIVESPDFGRVMIICIGATMVGSVVLTSGEDVVVAKGDELGYFQFGGSTLLVLFQRNRIRFDDDLVFNSAKQQETLVKMGMSLGRATRPAAASSASA